MELNLFLIFAILSIISAAMTIAASNPVHSVFYLILTFIGVSALFFLLGVEFLAVIFLIVYVGAVSILFLFVVMMLNIKLVEWAEGLTRFVPITLIIGLIFLSQATTLLDNFSNTNLLSTTNSNFWLSVQFVDWARSFINFTNVEMLGQYLYTDFSYLFLLSSMILLVAMIGAIILSLDHHRQIKRQDLYTQISTKSTVSLKTVGQSLILTRNYHHLSKPVSNTSLKFIKRNAGGLPELKDNIEAMASIGEMAISGIKRAYKYFYPDPVPPSVRITNPASVTVDHPASIPIENPIIVNVETTINPEASTNTLGKVIINGTAFGSAAAGAGYGVVKIIEQGGVSPPQKPQIRGLLPGSLLILGGGVLGASFAYNKMNPGYGYSIVPKTQEQAMWLKVLQSVIKESEENKSLLQKIEKTYGPNDHLIDLIHKSNQHLLDLCSLQPGQDLPRDPLEFGIGAKIKMEYLVTGKVSFLESASSLELADLDFSLDTTNPSSTLETNSQFTLSSPLEEPIGNKLPSFFEICEPFVNTPLEDLSPNFILVVGVYIGVLTIRCLMSIFTLFLLEQFREYLRLHPNSIFFRNKFLKKFFNKWSQLKLDYRIIALFCIMSILTLSSYHHQLILLLGQFYFNWKNE